MKDEGLIRAVGVRGLTAGIVNYTIGAGIFVVPALIAARVGAAAPIIYIICAVAMGLIVLCFADAGSRVSLSGGMYAYAEVAFGEYVGFMVAVGLWMSMVLASASVANVFIDTVGGVFDEFVVACEACYRGEKTFGDAERHISSFYIAPLRNDVAVFNDESGRFASVACGAKDSEVGFVGVGFKAGYAEVVVGFGFVLYGESDGAVDQLRVHFYFRRGFGLPCGVGEVLAISG